MITTALVCLTACAGLAFYINHELTRPVVPASKGFCDDIDN